MLNNCQGGNDTLIAGNDSTNYLYGDAHSMGDTSQGGDDRLVSGTGADHMWGDTQDHSPFNTVKSGADTFVFLSGNGTDDINDFRQSDHDKIDVSAYGFHDITDMKITAVGGGTKIAFDDTNSVTLVGLTDPTTLHNSDFIFA